MDTRVYFQTNLLSLARLYTQGTMALRKDHKLGNKHSKEACGEHLRYKPWQRAEEALSCHLPVVVRLCSA